MHRKILPAAAAAALVSTTALAHHGWSTYDASRTLVFNGPILSVKYENPHGELQLEHDGGRWTVTLAPPSRLRTRGVSAEDLTVGRTVKVEGYPSRVNEREMRAERITLEGRTVELR